MYARYFINHWCRFGYSPNRETESRMFYRHSSKSTQKFRLRNHDFDAYRLHIVLLTLLSKALALVLYSPTDTKISFCQLFGKNDKCLFFHGMERIIKSRTFDYV